MSAVGKGVRGSKINVVLRCRGQNKREIESGSDVAIDIGNSNEVRIKLPANDAAAANNHPKVYKLDRVYGSTSTQEEVFQGVVEPIFLDFLSGINCTIFAYGQTGAGKT